MTLQAQAARVEPQQIGVRRAVRLVALNATPHQPAADRAVLEAERSPLAEVTGPAQARDVTVADPAVRSVAVGALDALLVVDEYRVMAVEPEEAPDLVMALNTNRRLGPRDVLTVGLGRTSRGVTLPALDLAGVVVAPAPGHRRDLL